MELNNENIDATWIDVMMLKSKPITIGVCYQPSKQNNFILLFEEIISKIDNDLMVLGNEHNIMLF